MTRIPPENSNGESPGSLPMAVLPQCGEDRSQAEAWSGILRLPLLVEGDPKGIGDPGLVLLVHAGRASLCLTGPKAPGPLQVDFGSPALVRRARQGLSQSLARACGLRSGRRPRILDATAGLGRDAFVLAALGSEVTMVERHPVLHFLLELALERLRRGVQVANGLVQRLELIHGEAQFLFADESRKRPDVIYLDPMFPPRKKKALVKKEMQILQALLGEESPEESEALLSSALRSAKQRVVVKRPRISDPLGGKRPQQSFQGRSHRYDLYLVPGMDEGL